MGINNVVDVQFGAQWVGDKVTGANFIVNGTIPYDKIFHSVVIDTEQPMEGKTKYLQNDYIEITASRTYF